MTIAIHLALALPVADVVFFKRGNHRFIIDTEWPLGSTVSAVS
jgi:hypothetical protein